jgi:hypothetical protein
MAVMDETTRRRRLADRFVDYPLIMMLVLSPALPLVLGGLLLLGLGGILTLPRIWVMTPPGFKPVVKVRAVNLVKAWMLRRTAVRQETEGDLEQASRSWRRVVNYNRANTADVQALLHNYVHLKRPEASATRTALGLSFWLLRLTDASQSSLDVVGAVFVKANAPHLAFHWLRPREDRLSPAQQAAYLKALFLLGRVDEYHRLLERFGPNLPGDAELKLCEHAYTAGWGSGEGRTEARRQLRQAFSSPATSAFACRLDMIVCMQTQDAKGFEDDLARLQEEDEASPSDHVAYWRLLATTGRLADAKRLAESYPRAPADSWELEQMGAALMQLGCLDYAQQYFARFAPRWGDLDDAEIGNIWVPYADLLIQQRAWDDLRALALRMRTLPRARSLLNGFSYFVEGRALLTLGHPEDALISFRAAAEASFPIPAAGMQAAVNLSRLGYPELAEKILRPLETKLADYAAFWEVLFDVTYALKKDEALMLRAAAKARTLEPQKQSHDINYAAALLIARQQPEEAAKITLVFLQQNPNSLVARVDHAYALTLNRRFPEAATILESINPGALGELEATIYYLCWLEIHMAQDRIAQATQDLKWIRTKYLFPTQLKWFEGVRQRLEAAG